MAWSFRCDACGALMLMQDHARLVDKVHRHLTQAHGMQVTREQVAEMVQRKGRQEAA